MRGFNKIENGNYNAIQVQLRLAESDAAIAPADALSEVMTIQSNYPVLGIILNHTEEDTANSNYKLYKNLQLQRVNVQVQSEKIKALTIQSDDAVLNYKKPFEPFGLNPETGSHFYFAHPELCGKMLDTLTLHFDWMNKPDSLTGYYSRYETPAGNKVINTDNDFKAELKLVENDIAIDINEMLLFQRIR